VKRLRVGPRRLAGLTGPVGLLVVAALTLATAGCNANWGSYAARVNNATISPATLDSALSALKADPGFACLEFGPTFRVSGAGEHTYDVQSADFVLNQLIEYRVERKIASSIGAAAPSSSTTLASDQLQSRLESQLSAQTSSSCPRTGADLSKLGSAYKNVALGLLVSEDAIAAHLAGTSLDPESLAHYEAAHRSTTSESCISLIQVASKTTAAAIGQAIRQGATFSSEAAAHSIDSNNSHEGGYLGCSSDLSALGTYAKPIEALGLNQVTSPLEYSSGSTTTWLLFTVTSRPPESVPVLVEQLLSTEQTPFVRMIKRAIASTRVSLSSQYGSWPGTGEILPPSATSDRFAPDAGAVRGQEVTPTSLPTAGGTATGGG
jgi:hypothetical protein